LQKERLPRRSQEDEQIGAWDQVDHVLEAKRLPSGSEDQPLHLVVVKQRQVGQPGEGSYSPGGINVDARLCEKGGNLEVEVIGAVVGRKVRVLNLAATLRLGIGGIRIPLEMFRDNAVADGVEAPAVRARDQRPGAENPLVAQDVLSLDRQGPQVGW